ncbi:MAG: tetratricopeptide repeat protein [Bacteroidales bacterium]|nr:tetratricopeptide repeat protein [Bacteroidales bacterium]
MYRLLISVLFFAVSVSVSFAQSTREKARSLFLDGKYAEAKPLFKKLLKSSPRDGSYNYWYAVCCYETNDTVADVEKMLKYAVTRKVNNAHRYLGDMYKRDFRYDEAVASYEEFIDGCDDEELVSLYEERCEHVKRLHRMIKMTERVCVIDSFVVDKERFLSAYRTGRDIGTLSMAGEYFDNADACGTVAVTERGTDLYFSRPVATDEGEMLKLFHSSNVNNRWSEAKQLSSIETAGNDCYPFMAVDGSTFYFASDGEGSIGGYDIFVTRYDSEDGAFLRPENVGMPFNSEANDYMLVVNDIVNLGWFATDRRMDEGKVCVYVFVPNATKATYNYESEDASRIIGLSQLSSIADTQADEDVVRKARQKLLMLMYEQKDVAKKSGFLFVVDDLTEYTDVKQFKSAEARKLYDEWKKRSEKYNADVALLEKRRDEYAAANASGKQTMSAQLLELENRLIDEADALEELLLRVRNTEKVFISK